MTRHYIRLDPAFDERKESYPDGPYAALIGALCLAESQPERGRFRSADYLRRLLGKRGKHVAYLIDHGDVVTLSDGRVYIDGWDEWQEGDWKVAERVARIRQRSHHARPGNGACNGRVTVPDTAPRQNVAVRSGAEQSGALTDRRQTPTLETTGPKDITKKKPDDEELLDRYLNDWAKSTSDDKRSMYATQLRIMGVPDPAAELARRAA